MEFIDFMCAPLVPFEFAEVVEAQSRPSQRVGNEEAGHNLAWQSKVAIEAFQKRELYTEAKPPRNISTLPPAHRLQYSRFTLALANHLKTFKWYAFGRNLQEVGELLSDLAVFARTLCESDYSKFDGTHSFALYLVELAILLRCFRSQSRTVAHEHQAMTSARAKTRLGQLYDIDGSRVSGCADTTTMNTIDNGVVGYCTRRMTMSPAEAWAHLGLYGGDDGVIPDVDPATYSGVAKAFGLVLKPATHSAHEPCSFLGRVFPFPRTSPASISDLRRSLPKLCATTDLVLAPEVVLRNKAEGYIITDPETPVLGAWCRMVRRLTAECRYVRELRPYASLVGGP